VTARPRSFVLCLALALAEAYNNIAAADNAMERWEEGIQAAIQAMRIRPDFELARGNLMWALSQREKNAGHPMPPVPRR